MTIISEGLGSQDPSVFRQNPVENEMAEVLLKLGALGLLKDSNAIGAAGEIKDRKVKVTDSSAPNEAQVHTIAAVGTRILTSAQEADFYSETDRERFCSIQ